MDPNEIKIESGIPIRPRKAQIDWRVIFEKMNIGDSIVLPWSKYRTFFLFLNRDRELFKKFKIVSRKLNNGKYRCWKVNREENPEGVYKPT